MDSNLADTVFAAEARCVTMINHLVVDMFHHYDGFKCDRCHQKTSVATSTELIASVVSHV